MSTQEDPDASPRPATPDDRPPAGDERQPAPSAEAPPEPPPGPPGEPLPTAAWLRRRAWPVLRGALALAGSFVVQGIVVLAVLGFAPGAGMGTALLLGTGACCAFLLGWWWLVVAEPLSALGWSGPLRRIAAGLGTGLGAGVLLMAFIVGIGLATDAWTLKAAPAALLDLPAILGWSAVLSVAALFEEILLRGVLLQELGRSSLAAGVVVSSLVFAVIHVGNPATEGRLVVGMLVLNIFLAGLLLAAAFLHSGDLWLATGLHLGWNWAQGILFGLPVSGIDLPSFLTGTMSEAAPRVVAAPFGPEASVITTAVVGLAAIAWIAHVRRRGPRFPARR